MGQFCKDYEIRLHRPDGKLSLVAVVSAVSEIDARRQAESFLTERLTNAFIWRDGQLVDALYKLN